MSLGLYIPKNYNPSSKVWLHRSKTDQNRPNLRVSTLRYLSIFFPPISLTVHAQNYHPAAYMQPCTAPGGQRLRHPILTTPSKSANSATTSSAPQESSTAAKTEKNASFNTYGWKRRFAHVKRIKIAQRELAFEIRRVNAGKYKSQQITSHRDKDDFTERDDESTCRQFKLCWLTDGNGG